MSICYYAGMNKKQSKKSILRYPGGKTRAVKHITPLFPEMDEMVSPFFGGGSIEIAMAEQGVRVHGYDIFEPLVNFWNKVLKNPESTANMLEKLHPTLKIPNLSKSVVETLALKDVKIKPHINCFKEEFLSYKKRQRDLNEDEEIRACIFYALNRSSFSGCTMSGGYSETAARKRFTKTSVDRLREFYSPNLSVEVADFEDSLSRHDKSVFVYADPPYLLKSSTLYGDKGSTHKDFDHKRFANVMKKRDNWIISYNKHEDILKEYQNYKILDVKWGYGMALTNQVDPTTGKKKMKGSDEILIINT